VEIYATDNNEARYIHEGPDQDVRKMGTLSIRLQPERVQDPSVCYIHVRFHFGKIELVATAVDAQTNAEQHTTMRFASTLVPTA
jgi:hypothetical protein